MAEPDAPPPFFVGNALPDVLAATGAGRLRSHHVAACPDPDLTRGIALHLAADRQFHSSPGFLEGVASASAALRSTPFAVPPRRVFFLAHVFFELALDAVLLRRDAGIADDLYARFDACDLDAVAGAVAAIPGCAAGAPGVAAALSRWAGVRYLYDYARDDGLANALHRISLRAGLEGFPDLRDRDRLSGLFAAFLPRAAAAGPALWVVPPR
uniref:Uncharacterized protein n=1 Tax=uncultured Armatimonadetes bacterium TaxID=157466 RepID=A0A6J4K519_9BACT|nr:hypothetical protein AVDCRST_MAG63-4783 [uncultured Armatimonadetes bacterium]